MNYFVAEGAAELGALIPTWRDPAVRVVVLTGGVPDRFLTHYSVEELVALAGDQPGMRAMGTDLNDGYHAPCRTSATLRSLSLRPWAVTRRAAQTKRSVLRGAQLPLAEGLRVEAEAFLVTMLSEPAVRKMTAYVETPLEGRRAWVRSRATAVPGDPG